MKEQLQKDFIAAMKSKDITAKAAISSVKTEITKAEKEKNKDIPESEMIKIVAKQIKQREQSADEFTKGGREDLAQQELAEAEVLRVYLPAQMDETAIRSTLKAIMSNLKMPNAKALAGKSMGEFNKAHPGAADMSTVKRIVDELAEECT